ncbi:MAG: P-loop NTPase fold protein [Clostridia bacterium]
MSFEYSFVDLWGFSAKPSLIMLVAIIVILIAFKKSNKQYSVQFCKQLKTITVRNELVMLGFVYLIIIGMYYFQNVFNFQDSVIASIANLYLNNESLFGILLLTSYLIGIFIIKLNAHVYLNLINRISLVVLNTSLFFTLSTQQIQLTWYNWIVVLVCLFASAVLLILRFDKTTSKPNKDEIKFFESIQKYDFLFNNNKKHAEKLKLIIELQKEESLCICVSGKWGSGKTSVINGAIDLMKSNQNCNSSNLYIRINTLEIDSFDGLFKYFYSNVKSYLHEQGVYTGVDSEYQKFITSCIGYLTSINISDLVSTNLFNNNEDYRDKKDKLNMLLSDVLGENKVVVVVDDIERCSTDKIKQFVFFVKEIATFSKCVSVFSTDYDILMKSFADENMDKDFFDKFFNYRINIAEIDTTEMIKYYEKSIIKDEKFNTILQFSVEDSIESIKEVFETSIQELEKNQNSKEGEESRKLINKKINTLKEEFNYPLTNPRKMAKIFHVYKSYLETIKKEYKTILLDSELQKYAKNIQLGKLLFLLSYIEICLPYSFNEIQNKGVYSYLNEIDEHIRNKGLYEDHWSLDEEESLFTSISIGLVVQESFIGLECNYQHFVAHKFIDNLINEHSELKNIVNGFTTQELEYYNAIENKNLDNYDEMELKHIVLCVVRDCCYKNIDKGKSYLKFIFSYLYSKNIALDFLFEHEFDYLITEDLCVMEIIYNTYFTKIDRIQASGDLLKKIERFSLGYGYRRFKISCDLLIFFKDVENKVIEHWRELFFTSRDSLEDKIKQFIKENNDIAPLSNKGDDTVNSLIFFTQFIEQMVADNGFAEYPDFKEHIARMNNSVNDIKFFLEIQKKLANTEEVNIKVQSPVQISQENINSWLEYFNNELSKNNLSDEFINNVSNFFQNVENNSSIHLNSDNIEKLHEFLSSYYIVRRDGVLYYRKVLYAKLTKNS